MLCTYKTQRENFVKLKQFTMLIIYPQDNQWKHLTFSHGEWLNWSKSSDRHHQKADVFHE